MSSITNWLAMEMQWLQSVEEISNASKVRQHIEKSQWPMHIRRLWTKIVDNKKYTYMNWKRSLLVGSSGLNIRSPKKVKMKTKTTINLYNKPNKVVSSCAFHIWLCFFLNDNYHYIHCCELYSHCTIFKEVGSTITMSTKKNPIDINVGIIYKACI